jgi:hypothetical protein
MRGRNAWAECVGMRGRIGYIVCGRRVCVCVSILGHATAALPAKGLCSRIAVPRLYCASRYTSRPLERGWSAAVPSGYAYQNRLLISKEAGLKPNLEAT